MNRRGPITPFTIHEDVDRRSDTLPLVWEETGHSDAPPRALGPLVRLDGDALGDTLRALGEQVATGEVAAVALPWPLDGALLELLRGVATVAARTYVVLEEGEGAPNGRGRWFTQTAGRVRVRRGAAPAVGVVVAGRGDRATLLFGDDRPRWRLDLPKRGAEAAFRLVSHHFWHRAGEELRAGAFVPAGPAPYEVAEPAENEAVTLSADAIPGQPAGDLEVACTERVDAIGSAQPPLLFAPPEAAPPERLAALAPRVVWRALQLPLVLAGARGAVLEVAPQRPGRRPVRVHIAAREADRLVGALQLESHRPAWELRRDAAIGSLAGRIRLAGDGASPTGPRVVPEVRDQDAGEVRPVCLTDAPGARPGRLPAPPLARRVRYGWRVVPPTAAADARPAPLEQQWRALDAHVAAELQGARALLDGVARPSLAGRFARLASALLGFGRGRDELHRRLDGLESAWPSTRAPAAAHALLDDLAAAAREASRLLAEQARAVAAEEDRQERERQEEVHRASVKKAQGELAELDARRSEAQRDLAALDATAEPTDRADRKRWRRRVRDDRKRLQNLVKQLDRRCAALRQEAAAEFAYVRRPRHDVPSTAGPGRDAGGFVPAPPPAGPKVPAEARPAVGLLVEDRRSANGRALVIECWEQLAVATEEARRLACRVLAPADARGKR